MEYYGVFTSVCTSLCQNLKLSILPVERVSYHSHSTYRLFLEQYQMAALSVSLALGLCLSVDNNFSLPEVT